MWESPEQRTKNDPSNETIIFVAGYLKDSIDRGWFCKVSMNDLCVEDFSTTKRSALRKARKAWREINAKGYQEEHGYPRIRECQ